MGFFKFLEKINGKQHFSIPTVSGKMRCDRPTFRISSHIDIICRFYREQVNGQVLVHFIIDSNCLYKNLTSKCVMPALRRELIYLTNAGVIAKLANSTRMEMVGTGQFHFLSTDGYSLASSVVILKGSWWGGGRVGWF